MTFEDIEKLNYQQFASKKRGKKDENEFRPSDLLDLDEDNSTDDEILQKFSLKKSKKSIASPIPYGLKGAISRSLNPSDTTPNTRNNKQYATP